MQRYEMVHKTDSKSKNTIPFCRIELSLFESNSPMDALEQVWLKLTQCFWSKKKLNVFKVIWHFVTNFPWKKVTSLISANLNPLQPRMFVSSLVEIGPVVLQKKMKMWNVYTQTDRRRRACDHLSSLELSA